VPKPALLAPALSVLLVVGGLAVLPAACAVGYPTLPVSDGGRFLSNLSAPTLAPGASGTLSFTVSNPLAGALSDVVLTLQVYGFNAFPGNATGPLPSAGASLFSGVGSNGSAQVLSIGTIGPGGSYSAPGNTSVAVSAGSSAPSGTYAIRTSLAFTIGGVGYRLESRGFFSASQWASATTLPNNASTLNLSRLGVSGVIPETALLVETNSIAPWLYGVLAASLILAAAGGYVAWRRTSRSSSGARTPPPPQKARTALGRSRRSDGD